VGTVRTWRDCASSPPAGVVDGWMHSPPHKLNLLAKDFRTIGVGLHISADGHRWTQNFGY
jgi:uncharacterized protein YkwD